MTKAVAGLRRWAAGVAGDAAAVELLVCRFGGRYARTYWPWVRPCRATGWWWLDADRLAGYAGRLSGERRRLLMLAVSLLDRDTEAKPVVEDVAA